MSIAILFVRLLVVVMILSLGACSSLPGRSRSGAARSDSRPNIILIITDDQPYDTIGPMPIVQQELVGRGINFTQGFVTTPLCCPSRASILTGRFAHNHGVLTNRAPQGGAVSFKDDQTLAAWLQQAGYRTAWMGKYLNDYEEIQPYGYIPPGWDEWQVFGKANATYRFYLDYDLVENDRIVHYGTDETDYSSDVIAHKAAEFIESSQEQPFFLVLGFFAPHQPYTAAARHKDLFRTDEQVAPRRPPNFNEDDVSDKPAWVQALDKADPNYMDRVYQRSLRALMAVDEGIGTVISTLEDTGQRDRTMIVYISDNGIAWGEHRLSAAKNCGYEECIHVPFVISYPALISTPRQDDRLVANIDLAPTILELAEANPAAPLDGQSLLPLLKNEPVEWREELLIEHWPTEEGFGAEIPQFAGLRTDLWKYVEYSTGEKELYDLTQDPYEMGNLATHSDHAGFLADLSARLKAILGQ